MIYQNFHHVHPPVHTGGISGVKRAKVVVRETQSIFKLSATRSVRFPVGKGMAKYADAGYSLEICSVGGKVYYRSQAFWKANASANLPGRIGDTHYRGLNGVEAHCCVYGNTISVLTEQMFPNFSGELANEKPESNQLRRAK